MIYIYQYVTTLYIIYNYYIYNCVYDWYMFSYFALQWNYFNILFFMVNSIHIRRKTFQKKRILRLPSQKRKI